jgi:glycosyltransferase involved in cell wall biosynthesis
MKRFQEGFTMSDSNKKVSIIIPCYNAEKKLNKCVMSLTRIMLDNEEYEVIFVDDCSQDKTLKILENLSKKKDNWTVIKLEENSGSPSKPRNTGLQYASGEYVFFLDIDDEILPNALESLYTLAKKENSDIVRGSLIVDDGKERKNFNEIKNFYKYKKKSSKIEIIFQKQSTTPPALIRRNLLKKYGIQWMTNIRMGEDTIFLADVLSSSNIISYLDKPIYIYNKAFYSEASSTQQYGKKELSNHLFVWTYVQKKLEPFGIDYFRIRGQVALQTVLDAFRKYYQGDVDKELFEEFSNFVNIQWRKIKKFNFSQELKKMIQHVKENDYNAFFENVKPKLLIAGFDLKFILPLVERLKVDYNVKIDEWTGHNIHNEKSSKALLAWADIIFCEWLLGNAVWYAAHKLPHQKLIVRMHRFELTTEWGHKIQKDKVDTFITVGLYTFDKMIKTFDIDRHKCRLIHNFIDTDAYETSTDPEKVYNLGIIGILPARKGYLNALMILNSLVKKDKKYNLSVYGKMPKDFSWISNNQEEMAYYKQCEHYIVQNNLKQHLHIKGWVDTKKELKNIGFILSVSETGTLPESFHIAPAEGFVSGNQGVFLHWDGVEYLYPEQYIFNDLSSIVEYITLNSNQALFEANRKKGYSFIRKNYNTEIFLQQFKKTINR